MQPEQQRLDACADWYLNRQLDFDHRLIEYRFRVLRPWLRGGEGLELGPAEGQMTQRLLPLFSHLTVVDAAAGLLARIPDDPRLTKVCALFEDYQPERRFDAIVMEHILEHVESPARLLRRARGWLRRGGRLFVGVPNGHSLHRLVAVKMGLLNHPCERNERDHRLGHRRVYTPAGFRRELEAAGLRIVHFGGVFLKPLSNAQIETQWDEAMLEGFYQLGKEMPEYAAELHAVCESRR